MGDFVLNKKLRFLFNVSTRFLTVARGSNKSMPIIHIPHDMILRLFGHPQITMDFGVLNWR